MTYIPVEPLWCWVLTGADQMFLSQPTMAWGEGEAYFFTDWRACVARCQHETQFYLDDQPYALDTGAGLTPPVQCGQVASLDTRGRYFCGYHMQTRWACFHCHALVPDGEGGFCSQACRADFDAAAEAG
jgi:hypothetical protein